LPYPYNMNTLVDRNFKKYNPKINTIGISMVKVSDSNGAQNILSEFPTASILNKVSWYQKLLNLSHIIEDQNNILKISRIIRKVWAKFKVEGKVEGKVKLDHMVKIVDFIQTYQNTVLFILNSYINQIFPLSDFVSSFGTDNYFLLSYMCRKYLNKFFVLTNKFLPTLISQLTIEVRKVVPDISDYDVYNLFLLLKPISFEEYLDRPIPNFSNLNVCIHIRNAVKKYKDGFMKVYMNTISHWILESKQLIAIGKNDVNIVEENLSKLNLTDLNDSLFLKDYIEVTKTDLNPIGIGLYGLRLLDKYTIIVPKLISTIREITLYNNVFNNVRKLVTNITNFIDNDFLDTIVIVALKSKYDDSELPLYKVEAFDRLVYKEKHSAVREIVPIVERIARYIYIINHVIRTRFIMLKSKSTNNDKLLKKYSLILETSINTINNLFDTYVELSKKHHINRIELVAKNMESMKSKKINGISLFEKVQQRE